MCFLKKLFAYFIYLFIYFGSHHIAYRILILRPGIKPIPPALEAQTTGPSGNFQIFSLFFFFLNAIACEILVPGPQIQPAFPALEA